ncbi:MAG: phosphate transport system permease protein [Candidatus Argoarchaeum ethanivorans]|uniref:Phosphate transport system permease protein PstA n=1 Tax=Candidatus Argoarchaeum ethanivorans TaxID=2608793 RepID=A0A8B3RZA1_9EURY|nr:MAG: phosphate transport system permease protein [Candidatus Argoarchaeum ethanivorans]
MNLQEKRQRKDQLFAVICLASTITGIVLLALLLCDIFVKGFSWLSWDFICSYPSRFPERAGIKSAFWGSIWLILLTAALALPMGVSAAIYLEEYAPRSRLTKIIEINIFNLAGVPSVVYGILGLALFVRGLSLGKSLIAGALTLSLLVLPIIIISTKEALSAVPKSLREASYGLGASRWQTIRYQVLPSAMPWILTGSILALSRAIGETAPLIMIGALTFVAFTPQTPLDPFTAMPIQIFNWISRPQPEFANIASAAIIVLLLVLLTMNAAAIILRRKYQKKLQG